MSKFDAILRDELASIAAAGRYRRRRVVEVIDPVPTRVRVDGQTCLNFCSNDYLGLSAHPAVREALAHGARDIAGSGASHLVTGHSAEHHALEEELADFVGRERALLFSTGYMANLGIASALLRRGDRVFEDRLNHASLLDAGLASGAQFARYAHNDVESLEQALVKGERAEGTRALALTDGVFSMDGDVAPLAALAKVCATHEAWLVVDDAHGFGVLGDEGRGSVVAAGLDADAVPVYMATLGKALGVFGAFVAGSEALIETLIQKARTYIYTTALPPAVAAAARASLKLLREETWRRERLQTHIARFKKGATQLGLQLLPSDTAIQPLVLGDEARALAASEALLKAGILAIAIRPPTVPAGSARLRITLSAAHAEADIDQLLQALSELRIATSI